jgi:hypothetical protein
MFRISNPWRPATFLLAAVLAGAVLSPLTLSAPAQEGNRGGSSGTTEVEPSSGALLGPGDTRFGVSIEPGGGAVIANWQNREAVFVDDSGSLTPLDIRLKHQHTGVSVPPEGMVVLEDSRGRYYAINSEPQLRQLEVR